MSKCMASEDGVCKNVYAFGLKCDGYSTQCKLRPRYESIEKTCRYAIESIRRSFGIVGDRHD